LFKELIANKQGKELSTAKNFLLLLFITT